MIKTLLKLASICLILFAFAVQAVPARPNQPTVVLTYHPNVMSVYWDPVNRATRYNVIQIKDGQWSSVKTVTHTAADFVGAPGSVYQYAVNACDNTSECSFDSPYSVPFQMPAKTATPTFSPGSSQQYFGTNVTINAVSGATIYYTLNGTNPSTSSAVYSQPIRLSNNITIRAMAHKPGLMYSDIASAAYTIKAPPVPNDLRVRDGNSNEVIFSYGDTTSATYYLITPYAAGVAQTPRTTDQTSYPYPAIPFTPYSFTVEACNGLNCSAVSSRSAEHTYIIPPTVPTGVQMIPGPPASQMNLSWDGNIRATYYEVRKTVNGTSTIENVGNVTSKTYPGTEGSTYSFEVRACNTKGCSAFSAATPPYPIPISVATPQITPPSGRYSSAQTVNISVAGGDQIRYTQDGSDVTAGSPVYSGPFTVSTSRTVKARAFRSGAYGAQETRNYTIDIPVEVGTPQITPPSGRYSSPQTVSMSVAGGAQIRYTQDGNDVTESSPLYSGPFTVSTSRTVKARAYKSGNSGSQETRNYTIDIPVEVDTPQITPLSGTYSSAQTVSMSVSTSGAVIRYTVDGSTVNSSSPQYTVPFTVNTTRTVKARAYKSGHSGLETVRNYVIDIPVEVGTPQFSVPAGTYSSAQTVTLTATPTDAIIRYTLDGSSVTTSSAQYATPITVSASLTLKAKAFKGTSTSAESSAAYVINAAIPDWALRTESTVAESSVPFSPYQPSASVVPGVIAAEAGVSGGQAGYTIPISIVPGRAGMQPSVALSYSSRSGNGIAGMGWSLQAASAISRCGSSFATDGISRAVTLTNSDKLCYNGSRLMLVSGTYGTNGAEYALEMDNMSRVVQNGGDMAQSVSSFTVYEASGRTLQFGSSSNGKVVPAGQSITQQWLLQSVADVTGKNTMRYVYQHNAQAEVLLSQIMYTGNASSDDGRGMVEFAYQARNDKTLSYVAGGKVQQTQRLASITTSYDGGTVRQYRLGYGGVSAGSGRTLLRQITECAYFDGAVESCLAPTVFNWSEQHAGYALQYVPYAGYDAFRTITQALPRGDVNGDGSRDWNGNFVDAEDNLQATHNFELAGCYFDNHRQTYICNQADFNLDGRTDGTDETGSTLRLAITNGEGATLSASWINTGITLTGNSNSPLGRDRIEGFADFNGDGWPDLLMYRVNGSAPDYRVYLHSKNTLAPYAGSGIVVHTPALDGSPAERFATTSVQLTGDMNGDGLADLVVMNSKNRFYSYPQSMPAKVLYNSWNGSTLSFSSVNLPFAPTLHQWSYFSYFIDVNSDGLTDWIGWNDVSGLQYSLNTGKAFTPLADVSGDTSWLVSRSYHAINAVNASEEQTIYYPKYSGAFRVMDVNNDGQSELLVPGQRLIESCIIYGDMEGNRTITREFCGDAMYGAVRFNGNSHATSPIPAESIDESIYRYNAVQFTLAENGELSVALVPTDLIGSATQSAAVDAYGNGLDNLMFTYGTRFNFETEPVQRFNGSTSPLGSQYGTWINRNLGDSSSGQTMMDALVSVSDAAGKTARWNYLPLSSGQNTVDELPLYATSHDYVADNQHFHFASSMYVVSHFSQSNGTGGENQQRYAYRGAVYNHAGKGFSGFRSVIQQDMTRGIIEHADYLQKMPFTGRLQGLFKFRSSEYPGGQFNLIQGWSSDINYTNTGQDAFYVSGAEDAFEQTVQRWALNTVHKAQSGSCSVSTDPVTANEQWQCGEGQHRYSVYPVHSTTVKRDLQSKVQLSVQQTEQSAVDVYGNVLTQTQSTEDDYGLYSKTLTQVFDGSTSWPDKLSSRTVTSHAVQQRHANDPYNSSATPDVDSWVRTTFSNFHSSRQPQQVAVTASDSSRSKTITTSFNAYGLPLTLTETADVMDMAGNWQSSSRTTTLEYGDTVARADGAFVYRTTNPAQHTQVTKTSAATGLVQSSIDANNLQTQFSYDVFGRMTAQQTPGAGEVRVALDSTSYDNNAPQQAVWMQVTQQRGMPQQRVYFDMLGRDIRTAVQGFEGNWINRDKRYDAAGRLEAESQPYMQGSAPAWTEYSGFDELNRPGQKVTHDNRLS
ncbi:chitobiase/beta-hexosaminidase C-terminal domain-containing protein, partial [Rheinheimera muenzenbergensis]